MSRKKKSNGLDAAKRFLRGNRKPKQNPQGILVCCPMYRAPVPELVSKLYGSLAAFAAYGTGIELDLQITYGSGISDARTKAINTLLERGHEAIWFVDDDADWPLSGMGVCKTDEGKDAAGFHPLMRMLGHDADVVCALATNRSMPMKIQAGDEQPDGKCLHMEDPERVAAGGVEPIDFAGFHMALVRRRAILKMLAYHPVEALFAPYKNWRAQPGLEEEFQSLIAAGGAQEQFFDLVDKYMDKADSLGEDFAFCKRARLAGCDVLLDKSFVTMHYGTYGYSVSDWLALHKEVQQQKAATAEG